MDDKQIEELKKYVEACSKRPNAAYVGWLNDRCVTTHIDGPMGPKDCFTEVNKVCEVYERDDGPVALLDDGKGGYVALLACEATEFVLVSPLFKAGESND